MCDCAKPIRNDEMRGYLSPDGVPWRAPALREGEVLLFDECGRCRPMVGGKVSRTDFHPYHFRLVREGEHGQCFLLARHGGGDERIQLGYDPRLHAEILGLLDSDARFMLMNALYLAYSEAARNAKAVERRRWQEAAAGRRIRTRRRKGMVEVWIEPENNNNNEKKEVG